MAKPQHGHYCGYKTSLTAYVWSSMIQRCTNPKNPGFKNYGERGIFVCDRWFNFANFLEDMGVKPEGYTLDRIDNDGPYSKENCRWACQARQVHNSRVAKLDWEKLSQIKHMKQEGFTITQIAEQYGVNYSTIWRVLKGKRWKVELPAIKKEEG